MKLNAKVTVSRLRPCLVQVQHDYRIKSATTLGWKARDLFEPPLAEQIAPTGFNRARSTEMPEGITFFPATSPTGVCFVFQVRGFYRRVDEAKAIWAMGFEPYFTPHLCSTAPCRGAAPAKKLYVTQKNVTLIRLRTTKSLFLTCKFETGQGEIYRQ